MEKLAQNCKVFWGEVTWKSWHTNCTDFGKSHGKGENSFWECTSKGKLCSFLGNSHGQDNCTDFYGTAHSQCRARRRARAALSVALASETHTHTRKKTQKKKRPKRSTKRTVTPVNPGVAMRLVMLKISPSFDPRV